MGNLTLQATSPLNGYTQSIGKTVLCEESQMSMYSIALSQQPDAALTSITNELGAQWPSTGQSTVNAEGTTRLLGLQSDQVFALRTGDSQTQPLPQLDASAYITDQSDSWAALRINGPISRTALERICPIDLHPSVFPVGHVTRTTMEHLAVIILCESDNNYLLLSPTSSSHSFLHAIQTSLHNVRE